MIEGIVALLLGLAVGAALVAVVLIIKRLFRG